MISVKIENDIAIVTVIHGKANAIDVELCDETARCFDDLRGTKTRAVVITGHGKMFSAGVDLLRVSAGGADYVRALVPGLHRLFAAVFFHPKPVVAAINGHAIAGGCVLACCADRRIMAHGAGRVGITELLVGVPFPSLAFEVVRFAVPQRHLPEFIYGGATYDTQAALERGWIDEVVEADALMPRALAAANDLARLSPIAFAQTKRQLRAEISGRVERGGVAADTAIAEMWVEALDYIRDYVARTLKKA